LIVTFLQETHTCCENEKLWELEWGGKIIFAHGGNNSKEVAILLKNSLNLKIESQIKDTQNRFFVINLKIEGNVLALANIYAPNKNDPNFFDSFFGDQQYVQG